MDKHIASRLGFWASIYVAFLGVVYLCVIIYFLAVEGFAMPPGAFVQLASGIGTFLTLPGMVALFTAIKYTCDDDYRVLGSLGLSFTVLFAAMVSINRFVQLTVIHPNMPDVPADLTRFLPYEPGSVMLALEILGWGFFSSLAALCVAPLFHSSPHNKAIRWLFILYAVFSFMSVLGTVFNIALPVGPIAWGPILLALCILLAIYFRKQFIKPPDNV